MISNLVSLLKTSSEVLNKVKIFYPHIYNQKHINIIKFIMHNFYNNLPSNSLNQFIFNDNINTYGYNKHVITIPDINNLYLTVNTWYPNAKTPLHDHDEHSCLIMPIIGNLEQDIFPIFNNNKLLLPYNNVICKTEHILEGNIGYIDDNIGQHIIKNNDNKIVISLHFYHKLLNNKK